MITPQRARVGADDPEEVGSPVMPPTFELAHRNCYPPTAPPEDGALSVPVRQLADDLPAPVEDESSEPQVVTVFHDPDVTVCGLAQCLGEAREAEDGEHQDDAPSPRTCPWESEEPVPLELLHQDMGEHTVLTGHTRFVRYVADHVTVTVKGGGAVTYVGLGLFLLVFLGGVDWDPKEHVPGRLWWVRVGPRRTVEVWRRGLGIHVIITSR